MKSNISKSNKKRKKAIGTFIFQKAVSYDSKILLGLRTTKSLSVSEFSSMGFTILIFHLDCHDCLACQKVHQKLNKLNQILEEKGYILLLYYCRSDQQVFASFREEFENKIDYVLVDYIEDEFKPGSECKSSLFEVHETVVVNRFTHNDLMNNFVNIIQNMEIDYEDEEENNQWELLESPQESLVLFSPRTTPVPENRNSSIEEQRRGSDSDNSDPVLIPSSPLTPKSPKPKENLLRRITKRIFKSTEEDFDEEGEVDPEKSEPIEETFWSRVDENEELLLGLQTTREVTTSELLEMGFKIIIYHMDNLKCKDCLRFHEALNDNNNKFAEQLIIPMLHYSRKDQDLFKLLNDYTKNKLDIIQVTKDFEAPLKQSVDTCEACIFLILDSDNISKLSHHEMTIEKVEERSGVNDRKEKEEEIKENEFKNFSVGKLDEIQYESVDLNPKFISHNLSLDDVLKNEKLRRNYLVYLKTEHAEENLIFYEHVQTYKSFGWTKRKLFAKEMIKVFFDENAKYGLNTSTTKKEICISQMKLGKKDLFDSILIDTKKLIDADVLSRFLDTQSYE
jgi:thiol-disulfide isomerase/thioredoxin